jgi:hypothetical protein
MRTMKNSIKILATIVLVSVPLLSFAQTTQPLTRAQVRAQLVELEKAGYQPGATDSANYPENIRAAEGRIAAQKVEQGTAYGPAESGTSQSGKTSNGASQN